MSNREKTEEPLKAELFDGSLLEDDDISLGEVIPSMNVSPVPIRDEEKSIVKEEELLGLFQEIRDNCRVDRKKVESLQDVLEDMALNDGDSTNATKEAMVNLMKIKTDINDKLSKVADFMTRIHLKERDTFPRYLAAHQHNNVTIENKSVSRKRSLLQDFQGGKS